MSSSEQVGSTADPLVKQHLPSTGEPALARSESFVAFGKTTNLSKRSHKTQVLQASILITDLMQQKYLSPKSRSSEEGPITPLFTAKCKYPGMGPVKGFKERKKSTNKEDGKLENWRRWPRWKTSFALSQRADCPDILKIFFSFYSF